MIKYKKELKNIGITPIEEISVQEKTEIAEKVTLKLLSLNIPEISNSNILERLFEAKMYTAKINKNLGKVNYFCKNKTIYFDKNLNLQNIDENIMRECIHYLQDQRGKREKLKRMGLCTFEDYKVRGMALNEIGINYISNKLFNKFDKNKTYTLLKQILLITGEEIFLSSLLNSDSKFEEKFMEQTNSEVLYYKIQNNLDSIFDLEQIIKRLNANGKESPKALKYLSKINMHKNTINSKFSQIQWEIYNRYFSRKLELVEKIEEIKQYKNEMFAYNQWLDISGDEEKYTKYATEKFERLNNIELEIIRETANNSLVVVKESKFNKIIRYIKKLIFKEKEIKIEN